MTDEERIELVCRKTASELKDKMGTPISGADIVSAVEIGVQRRLIAKTLPGGLLDYWTLILDELERILEEHR